MSGALSEPSGELPILIKLIDAKKDLSVQVHPSDAYARENENGQLGKTEMWYVLDAKKDAKLIYGLYHDVTKEQLRRSIEDGTVEKYLQKVPVKKNDLFYIEAGTIHAIGAGVLVAEIQESSNLTYRLYDYDRVGKDGKKRELHIDKALETADLNASAEPRQPLRVLKYRRGCASELLCRCKYFEVYVCWSIPSDAGSLWTIGRMAAPSACCSAPTDAAASPSEISPSAFSVGTAFLSRRILWSSKSTDRHSSWM